MLVLRFRLWEFYLSGLLRGYRASQALLARLTYLIPQEWLQDTPQASEVRYPQSLRGKISYLSGDGVSHPYHSDPGRYLTSQALEYLTYLSDPVPGTLASIRF